MRKSLTAVVLVIGAVAAACVGNGLDRVAPAPGSQPLSKPQLELRVLHAVGDIFYCDPDLYPVGRGTRAQQVAVGFRQVVRDPEALRAIAADLHVRATAPYDEPTKARVWDAYKRMNALGLQQVKGGYDFDVTPVFRGQSGQPGHPTVRHGFVSLAGAVYLGPSRADRNFAGCPICLVRGTRVATPGGAVAVDRLRVGDPIWTDGAAGLRVATHIVAVGRVAVGPVHAVVVLRLRDGRVLTASPGHPLADGRRLMDLTVGSSYDGSRVVAVRWED